MSTLPRKLLSLLLCLSLAGGLTGCSAGKVKKYKVSGTLKQGGGPVKGSDPAGGPPAAGAAASGVMLSFYPAPEGARPANPAAAGLQNTYAILQPGGEFEVPDGLPAGKYIVVVHSFAQGPQFPDSDRLKNRFSFQKSPIEVDIDGDKVLDIDLDKYAPVGVSP